MATKIEADSKAAEIVAGEENLLVRVQTRLAEGDRGDSLAATASDLDRELLALRDLAAEARAEDLPPIIEQMSRLSAIRAKIGSSKSVPVDPRSPYFAHMVLREEGKSRDVMIGKRGFIDRQVGVQIVDWRNAPISQVYYRYDEGDDYDETVGGRRFEGIVDVRRNLSIYEGKLRRIGTPDTTLVCDLQGAWHEAVGELKPTLQGGVGKAVRVPKPPPKKKGKKRRGQGTLGVHHEVHRADKHLPEIAALIDGEQFDLISHPESGVVVIQGGAGSGKTTVALHRIAFLAFADKQRFRPNRMLFVVPTRSLARYVEGVLPSLGVFGVSVVTYAQWAGKQRRRVLPATGTDYTEDTPSVVAKLKKHPALLAIVDDYIGEQIDEVSAEIRDLDAASGHGLMEKWRQLDDALVPRLNALLTWIRKSLESDAKERSGLEAVLRRRRRRLDDIVGAWGDVLTNQARLEAGFARYGGASVSADEIAECVSWSTRLGREETEVLDAEGRHMETADGRRLDGDDIGGRFDREDDAILLRLCQRLRGGLMARNVKETWYEHVAIDEAQDRSAMEMKVLLEATTSETGAAADRSVTIAGDMAQRLIFDNHFENWQALLTVLGFSQGDSQELVKPLELSYRSTAEVMQLAREVLGPKLAPQSDLIARSGAPVELYGFGDSGEAVAFLGETLRTLMIREATASVAVIARYPEQADLYYQGLLRAEVPALRRVRNHEFEFVPGIDVTDVSQVKGLEFDYVIMVEVTAASYPQNVEARHLLHIGATRAAYQLWLVSTGPASRLLPPRLREGGLFAL